MNDQDTRIRGNWQVIDRVLSRNKSGAESLSELEAAQEKHDRKTEYEAINRALNDMRIGKYSFFLNYGYVPNENPTFSIISSSNWRIDTHSRRLVLEVLGDCPINGLDVLDVSCGRGGVSVVLQSHYEPGSYLGIDLSAEAIAFCSKNHRVDAHTFKEGDAESLPVDDASFDVLVNIEASHNYPYCSRFFAEAWRILRPGGWFLYADFLPPDVFKRHDQLIAELGFVTTREQDITTNVLLACDAIGAMRTKAYKDAEVQKFMVDFLAAPGSKTYCALSESALSYRLYTYRKPPVETLP